MNPLLTAVRFALSLRICWQELNRSFAGRIQAAEKLQQRQVEELGHKLEATQQEASSAHSSLKQLVEDATAQMNRDFSLLETKTVSHVS